MCHYPVKAVCVELSQVLPRCSQKKEKKAKYNYLFLIITWLLLTLLPQTLLPTIDYQTSKANLKVG